MKLPVKAFHADALAYLTHELTTNSDASLPTRLHRWLESRDKGEAIPASIALDLFVGLCHELGVKAKDVNGRSFFGFGQPVAPGPAPESRTYADVCRAWDTRATLAKTVQDGSGDTIDAESEV